MCRKWAHRRLAGRLVEQMNCAAGFSQISSHGDVVNSRYPSGTAELALLVGMACAETRAACRTRRTPLVEGEQTRYHALISQRA